MAQRSRLSSFLTELKRRRVFRMAVFCGDIAFVIMQIIEAAELLQVWGYVRISIVGDAAH